jgi:hypothetical protein
MYAKQVCAWREDDSPITALQLVERLAVRLQELGPAPERLDSFPPISRCDTRVQSSAWLVRAGTIRVPMFQHPPHASHTFAPGRQLLGLLLFSRREPRRDLRTKRLR